MMVRDCINPFTSYFLSERVIEIWLFFVFKFNYLEFFIMNFYSNYKSPLGYQTGKSQIDTYGVDHSGFSTRDELEYQFARQNKN